MRAETLRTIASIASHAATLYHSILSSACKKKSKRRMNKRKKERGKDGILEESFQSVFDAFQNEQTYEKFKKHVVTREVLSRRKSEIEETKGSQDSEEDLLDDWIVLEEESSEVDEGEKEEALKVAVVKVLVSAYEKIRRDEGENEIIKEREFFDAFNASLKSWSDTSRSRSIGNVCFSFGTFVAQQVRCSIERRGRWQRSSLNMPLNIEYAIPSDVFFFCC